MRTIYILLLSTIIISNLSCKKYLDKTPNKQLTVPKTVKDLQALLDDDFMTQNGINLNDLGSDDYYLKTADWSPKSPVVRNAYNWEKDVFQGARISDWDNCFRQIYICNVVLEGLKQIEQTTENQVDWNNVKGHALFCRAFVFYNLNEAFGYPYNPATATTDLGVPLRLTSNLEEPITRSSVLQTFERVLADLEEAKELVPLSVDLAHRNRPTKSAILAMLARAYLTMQNYDKANFYADQSLSLYSTLVDYATYPAPTTTSRTFKGPPIELSEIIYTSIQLNYGVFSANTTNIDTTLYNSYSDNDLRKTYLFGTNTTNGTTRFFRGQYTGLTSNFSGIATDEVYFIRAETFARKGNAIAAMADLNTVLLKRWKANLFTNYTAVNAEDALVKILTERRKELIFRGLRWTDLRRLNQDPRFQKTLMRVVNGQQYELASNSPRYVYPIPDYEIQASGIQQNPR